MSVCNNNLQTRSVNQAKSLAIKYITSIKRTLKINESKVFYVKKTKDRKVGILSQNSSSNVH